MMCVLILYIIGGTYSLKSTPNDKFLRNFSWQFELLSEFFPEICWEEIAWTLAFTSNFFYVILLYFQFKVLKISD